MPSGIQPSRPPDRNSVAEGVAPRRRNPRAWRPGLLGVTDEHGTDWGRPTEKGRAGLWVTELSRAGVRAALAGRRFFATRERGLRVDATLGGVRMGRVVPHRSGPLVVALDIEGASVPEGTPLVVQVLRSGSPVPTVTAEQPITVPGADAPAVTFSIPVDSADGGWVVLRIVDPAQPGDPRAPTDLAGRTIAYPSPWYLSPA